MTRADVIDLRAAIDQVYNQGAQNSCIAHATKAAIETMFDRSPTHKGRRVSARFLHNTVREMQGTLHLDTGTMPSAMSDVLRRFGFCLQEDFPEGEDIYTAPDLAARLKALRNAPALLDQMPYLGNDVGASIERSIDLGMPLVILINITPGFLEIPSGTPWQQMRFNGSLLDVPLYEHAMCVVGYDRKNRIALVENSWGPTWGDGGFYGLTYDKFEQGPQRCVTQLWRFEQLPVDPVRVEDYMPAQATLNYAESAPLRALEASLLEAKRLEWIKAAEAFVPVDQSGQQWIIDAAAKANLTDRMVEIIFHKYRGWLKDYIKANGLDRGALVFEQIV